MRTPKPKVGEVRTTPNYSQTLRSIPIGETWEFTLAGADYNGFHTVKTRLNKKGYRFEFDRRGDVLRVTRVKPA